MSSNLYYYSGRVRYVRSRIKYVSTNPLTNLEEDDHQALLFSARQEPQNLSQYQRWCEYATAANGKFFQCYKRESDSPRLTSAVAKEQSMVVHHEIRKFRNKFNLNIPEAIDGVVISFYKQKAIYPVPQPFKYLPPYRGSEPPFGPFSWKIDEGESLKHYFHPLNEEDRVRHREAYEKSRAKGAKDQQIECIRKGCWKRKSCTIN